MSRIKRIFFIFGIFIVVFLALDVGLVIGVGLWSRPLVPADAVVILGAAINSPALNQRTLAGFKIYQEGLVPTMVLSGGKISWHDMSEARGMLRTIEKETSENPEVLLDEASNDTLENLVNSKQLLGDDTDVIIVSDKYHLARAVLLAKRLGYDHVQWSSPSLSYYKKSDLVHYYFREMAAMIAYLPHFVLGK